MKNKSLIGFASVFCTYFLISCTKESSQKNTSELKYSINKRDLKGSLLAYIKDERSPKFCVVSIGGDRIARMANEVRLNIEISMDKWFDIAKEHRSWPEPNKRLNIQFSFSQGSTEDCDRFTNIFVWTYEHKSDFEKIGTKIERSHAVVLFSLNDPLKAMIHLQPGDEYGDAIVGHELGHALGLGDTYKEDGYIEGGLPQPPSSMNGESDDVDFDGYPSLNPSQDDYEGIHAILDYYEGRATFCREGYKVDSTVKVKPGFDLAFCAKKE